MKPRRSRLPYAATLVLLAASAAWADDVTIVNPPAGRDDNGAAAAPDGADDGADDVVSQTEVKHVRVQTQNPDAPTDAQSAGTASDEATVERTVVTERQPERGGLRDEVVGIKPQFGVLTVNDETRGAAGLTVDVNLLRDAQTAPGRPYFGPSVGAIYSHLGYPGSDFFGLDSPIGDRGTHLLMLPVNLKAGYTFGNSIRLAAHGGASVMYANTGQSASLGPVTVSADSSSWNVDPNVGADVELGLGRHVALQLRPDWTFSDNTVFTGTLGIAFPIS
jgi:hypothetical protein